MRKRFLNVLAAILILAAAGALYKAFVLTTNIYIPCLFYEKTGLYCPGCGISRMFIRLFDFDFYGAFRSNVCLFTMFPILMFYAVFKILIYIRSGKRCQTKTEMVFVWTVIVILLLFGVLRNFSAFSYLAPI